MLVNLTFRLLVLRRSEDEKQEKEKGIYIGNSVWTKQRMREKKDKEGGKC